MKHWLPYKLRFLGFKLEKDFGVFKDPKIRVTQVFLRYGSKVKGIWYGRDPVVISLQLTNFQSPIGLRMNHQNIELKCHDTCLPCLWNIATIPFPLNTIETNIVKIKNPCFTLALSILVKDDHHSATHRMTHSVELGPSQGVGGV